MEIVNAIMVLVTNKFPMVVLWGPLGGSDSVIFLECLTSTIHIKKCYMIRKKQQDPDLFIVSTLRKSLVWVNAILFEENPSCLDKTSVKSH